jgi:hypothetical protein
MQEALIGKRSSARTLMNSNKHSSKRPCGHGLRVNMDNERGDLIKSEGKIRKRKKEKKKRGGDKEGERVTSSTNPALVLCIRQMCMCARAGACVRMYASERGWEKTHRLRTRVPAPPCTPRLDLSGARAPLWLPTPPLSRSLPITAASFSATPRPRPFKTRKQPL